MKQVKKIAFLGDSITEGIGVQVGERYFDYLKDMLSVDTFGYGKNGARYLDLMAQAQQLWKEKKDDIDCIIIFAGTNDFYGNIPIGDWFAESTKKVLNDISDPDSIYQRRFRSMIFDKDTFRGRINMVLSFLKAKYVEKEIILLTPIHRAYATFGPQNVQYDELYSNDLGIFFEEYVKSVREGADIWAVRLIDAYRDSGLFPLIDDNAIKYFVNKETDRLHLNKFGHYRLAELIASYIKTNFKN